MVRASIFNVYFLALILFFFLFIFIACCGGQVESRLNITSCSKCTFWQFFLFPIFFFTLCLSTSGVLVEVLSAGCREETLITACST